MRASVSTGSVQDRHAIVAIAASGVRARPLAS
jgi:hypothetical protein